MDYCSNNIIGCSLIYGINLIGVVLILFVAIRQSNHYLWAYKSLKQDPSLLEYTIDVMSEQNMPQFMKYLSVQFGFCVLFCASLISICMWDSDFGYMEIAYLFVWTACGLMFYLDYKPSLKFSKELRVILGVLLFIQITTMIIFAIERSLDDKKGDEFLYTEVSVYTTNFIIMFLINIVSVLYPKFHYIKNYRISQDIIQPLYPTRSESIISTTNQFKQKQKSSFLEQLDEVQDVEQSMQKIDFEYKNEEDLLKKQQEDQEINDQIQNMHSLLDEKLTQLEVEHKMNEQEHVQDPQSQQQQQQQREQEKQQEKEQEKINKQQLLIQQNNQKEQQQSNNKSKDNTNAYDILKIRVEGFQEIKKQKKRQIYFNIIYSSQSLQKELKTEHSLKEFQELKHKLKVKYVDHTFPELPVKKANEKLSSKDLTQRGKLLEDFLKYIVKHQMKCIELDEFLKETQSHQVNEAISIDSMMEDNNFDYFFSGGQTAHRKSLYDMKSDIDSQLQSLSQTKELQQQQNKPQEIKVAEFTQDYKFYIREYKKQSSVIYYKIEGDFGGVVTSNVLRRYNDFKQLNKKLLEKSILCPILPDDPPQSQDKIEWRMGALTEYICQLYKNQDAKVQPIFKEFLGI